MYFNNLPQKVLLDSQGPCLACSSATGLHDFLTVYLFSIRLLDSAHKYTVGPSFVSIVSSLLNLIFCSNRFNFETRSSEMNTASGYEVIDGRLRSILGLFSSLRAICQTDGGVD